MNVDCGNVAVLRRGLTRAEMLALVAVTVVLAALLVPLLTSASKKAHQEAALVQCRENLRTLGLGFSAYLKAGEGSLPVSATVENPHVALLHALTPTYVTQPQRFYCPAESDTSLSYSDNNFHNGTIGYFYYSATDASSDAHLSKFLRTGLAWPHTLTAAMVPTTWVMSDIWLSGEPTAHAAYRKGVNYLMLDGSVGFASESPRQSFH